MQLRRIPRPKFSLFAFQSNPPSHAILKLFVSILLQHHMLHSSLNSRCLSVSHPSITCCLSLSLAISDFFRSDLFFPPASRAVGSQIFTRNGGVISVTAPKGLYFFSRGWLLNVKVVKTSGPDNMAIIVFALPSRIQDLASHVRPSITGRGCVDRVWGRGPNVEKPQNIMFWLRINPAAKRVALSQRAARSWLNKC